MTEKAKLCNHNSSSQFLEHGGVLVSFPTAGHSTEHPQLEEKFNLGHSFSGFCMWSAGSKSEASWQKYKVQ